MLWALSTDSPILFVSLSFGALSLSLSPLFHFWFLISHFHSLCLCDNGHGRALNPQNDVAFSSLFVSASPLFKTASFKPVSPSSSSTSPHNSQLQNLLLRFSEVSRFTLLIVSSLCKIWPLSDQMLFWIYDDSNQAPVAVQENGLAKTKRECYGVFCLTYDLKAVSFSFSLLCS